jgi:hypothetical protein
MILRLICSRKWSAGVTVTVERVAFNKKIRKRVRPEFELIFQFQGQRSFFNHSFVSKFSLANYIFSTFFAAFIRSKRLLFFFWQTVLRSLGIMRKEYAFLSALIS